MNVKLGGKMKNAIILATVLALMGIVNAQYSSMDVESKIYCPCGCGEILANCHCETAVQLRSEINRELLAGKTSDELINKYVTLYGSSILVNQELEAIKSASKRDSRDMLPFYILGLAITGFVAYTIGKSRRDGDRKGKKRGNKKWEL